jgi:hypothetical protein
MSKEYLQAKETSKWTSTMEGNIFFSIFFGKTPP